MRPSPLAVPFHPFVLVLGLLCSLLLPAVAQQIHCSPCSYAFGKVQIGTSVPYSFELLNTGDKTLRITAKSEEGAAFTIGIFPVPVKLAPGASVLLPVIFTPTSKGYTGGVLTIDSNSPDDSTLQLHVAGTGYYPSDAVLDVKPSDLNFGKVTVGSSSTQQATLSALGAAVTISADQSTSSEFTISGLTLPVTIPSGKSVPVTIQFAPNASGIATAKAGFTSNATDSPAVEQLTGTGVAAGSHSVDLTWDSGSDNIVGYNVYRGTSNSGPFTEINTALDASTTYVDNTVSSGQTYYYVATEVSSSGEESSYSNVAQAVIPNQ
jgi:hypothetical protein